MDRLTRLVEAALYSADSPLTLRDLRAVDREATPEELEGALGQLRTEYDERGHGVELVEVADGYQILTCREFADAIAQAHLVTRPRRLSIAALETIAIVAYRQPVGRADIEEIRGVSVEGVLRSLQERALIEVVGRTEGMGRPLLYGTTPTFLELLGLNSLDQLPRSEELSVSLRYAEGTPGEQE